MIYVKHIIPYVSSYVVLKFESRLYISKNPWNKNLHIDILAL